VQLAVAAFWALIACGAGAAPATPAPHELSAGDVDAWLDGFLPYALARGDIAGAQVVVVKDGQVLTQRGYGYADIAAGKKVDPVTTMFRVGSISKLYTWTAVMQLVEQRQIELDADVNRYLDFKLPAYDGKPVTMRQIMTHTAGFEDVIKGGFSFSGAVDPLGEVVKRMLPHRVFAPGGTPAYSNYATALAGYIVERVSGLTFDAYIERHIFRPLGMQYASFRQPLPESLQPFMAKGYPKASADAKPFELISVPPAGSLSVSAADSARFMIAHLDHGRGLMRPETARLMQTPASGAIPGLNQMALGFYEQRVNDTYAIGHGGDLLYFHGYLWLFPEKNVGLLVDVNSAGAGAVAGVLRQALFDEFADRYFPRKDNAPLVELASAPEHARMLAGSYGSSRAAFTNFLDVGNLLGQYRIELDADGRPLVPELFDGPPRKWLEVAPFVWQDARGHARLAAVVEGGRVVRWSVNEVSPFMVFDRLPWYRDAAWLLPLVCAALLLVLVTALSWPVGVLLRKHYDAPHTLDGRALLARRLVSAFGGLLLAALAGWAGLMAELEAFMKGLDWQIWTLEIAGAIAVAGLLGSTLWRLALNRRAGALELLRGALLVLAALVLAWAALAFHLISFGANY
jgi:CubicO group peptidase (beta-lactamase class C family)